MPNAGVRRPGFPLSRERRGGGDKSRFEILAEVLQHHLDWVHRGLEETADRCVAHDPAQLPLYPQLLSNTLKPVDELIDFGLCPCIAVIPEI